MTMAVSSLHCKQCVNGEEVIEHPASSGAFKHFGITKPNPKGGWAVADSHGGQTCIIDQRNYGHLSGK